ncbi:MAG: hypothetical protein JW783_14985 [Bacteroidales bacterium]|nr:hypothetical protein [Bacteroidales bacterium]MBN2747977.1 hypothetical protein [Bacteroidales bacterium]
MAGPNNRYIKKQKADLRAKKRIEKQKKKEERKENPSSGNLEDMIAYVDKFGNITSEPPAQEDAIGSPDEDDDNQHDA